MTSAAALIGGSCKLVQIIQNNEYSSYQMMPEDCALNPLEVEVIWPALDGHIKKHRAKSMTVVRETAKVYALGTKAWLRKSWEAH